MEGGYGIVTADRMGRLGLPEREAAPSTGYAGPPPPFHG